MAADSGVPAPTIYYGDNLDVLRRYVKDESVDLVYLDPPFNSKADYNVLFAEHDGAQAASQIKAFHDTWHWDQAAAAAFEEFVVTAPHAASQALQAFRTLLGCNDMLAYLSMMAPRLVELHRVLKPTGSLYLHCDPTASHYLKVLLDAIFGKDVFRNEITWKRTHAHGDSRLRLANVSDRILFYAKSDKHVFVKQYVQYPQSYIDKYYRHADADGRRYQLVSLRSPHPRPNLTYVYKEIPPHKNGWAVSREKMEQLDREGRLRFPDKPGQTIREKYYLDEMKGVPLTDLWDDIPPINSQAAERLGYPTQKPEALLERIVKCGSKEGDFILDPFCGCGTAIAVAQRLNRRWVGIDITHLAIGLIKVRLRDAHGIGISRAFKVVGEPVSLPDAETLAAEDRYQFQYWALGLLGARPVQSEQKKGADRGVDGRLYFHDDAETGNVKQVIFSVKSGHLKNEYVRELPGVVDREKAQIGVLVTLESPTQPMRTEAASAGFYQSPWGTKHPKVQILTVAEILDGKQVDMPPARDIRTFKKAPKVKRPSDTKAHSLFGDEDGGRDT